MVTRFLGGRRAAVRVSFAIAVSLALCGAPLSEPVDGPPPVAVPLSEVHSGVFDANMPSYRFVVDVVRSPGRLIQKDKAVVALERGGVPAAIFAHWDGFESYATCSGDAVITCEVSYFDIEGGRIIPFVLPLEAALSHEYMVQLVFRDSEAFRTTPPVGLGVIAVRNRYTPLSGFARMVSYDGADLHMVDPGIVAMDHPEQDYPYWLYVLGTDFQASGHCSKRETMYCIMNFFEYKDGQARKYLIGLEQALEWDTYLNIREDQRAGRLEQVR